MKKDEIWHSKLDLNIENKKPYKPTFRVAMPILDNGNFTGMVIANLLIDNLLKQISTSSAFLHYIIDKDGYFIYHPDVRYS